jgi:multiple sugar transport system substrate-binding protein
VARFGAVNSRLAAIPGRGLQGAVSASARPALALALALALSGCSRAPDTSLTFWAMGREGEVVAGLMPDFEREHPGLHVRVQQIPWTSAHEKLLTAFVGDSTPDVAQLGNTWIPEFAQLGAISPLDARVAQSKAIPPADYFPGIWSSNVVGGVLRGVPWYVDTRVLFYRTDMVRRAGCGGPPADWGAWADCLARVKAIAGPGNFSILLPLDEFEPLTALALQQDEPLLREDGRYGNFRSPGFASALAFYVRAFREGWAPRITREQVSNVWEEFGRGYYSFHVAGPWNIAEFRKRLAADRQGDWGTAPLPGPRGPGASIAGGSSLVLFRRSRHADEAWQLVEYLSRPGVEERFRELTGDLPPRRSAWLAPALAADTAAQGFRQQLERVRATPAVPEWERIGEEMRNVSALVVGGRLELDRAGEELDRRVDAILAKRRWMLERPHPLPSPASGRGATERPYSYPLAQAGEGE